MSRLLVASELTDGGVTLSHVSADGSAPVVTVEVSAGFHVVVHPTLPLAYLTSGSDGGSVVAVALAGPEVGVVGRVTEVGGFPCHLALSADGSTLATANYVGGSVSFIELVDGLPVRVRSTVQLPYERGRTDERQDASHPHAVHWMGEGVLVTDLGTDTVWRVDPGSGTVAATYGCPAGSGPRHLALDPYGRLWASLELSAEVGLLVPGTDLPGTTVTAPGSLGEPIEGVRNYPGDLISAGRWIVMANRGPDTVAMYDGWADEPELFAEVPCGGTWPSALASDGTTLAVGHRDSDSVALFPVTDSGVGEPTVVPCTRPIALAWYGSGG